MFLDNLDRIKPEVQQDILMDVVTIQEISRIRTLLPMRLASFANLNVAGLEVKPIRHVSSGSYKICVARLEHLMKNHGSSSYKDIVASCKAEHFNFFMKRLSDICSLTADDRAILEISWLAGPSIRRGLKLWRRVFINSTIPYNATEIVPADIVRCALLTYDERRKIAVLKANDEFVSNILINPLTNEFSWITVRVLQLVYNAERLECMYTVRQLIQDLKLMRRWDNDEIRLTLNYLLTPTKNLIRSDAKSEYASVTELYKSSGDRLDLTTLGRHYLTKLLRSLVYVQESAMEAWWTTECGLPRGVPYNDIVERFRILRLQLKVMEEQDLEEFHEFLGHLKATKRLDSYHLYLVSHRMILSVANAFLRIMHDATISESLRVEYLGWKSLLTDCYNHGVNMTEDSYSGFSDLIVRLDEQYEKKEELSRLSNEEQRNVSGEQDDNDH